MRQDLLRAFMPSGFKSDKCTLHPPHPSRPFRSIRKSKIRSFADPICLGGHHPITANNFHLYDEHRNQKRFFFFVHLLTVTKHQAVLIDEAENLRFPSGALQNLSNRLKYPVR